METKSRSTAILSVIIAVLAIAAGALWYAHSGLKTELAKQLDVHRALETERDGLKTESQSQRERITALGSDMQALQGSRDEKAAEVQRLSASAAESLLQYKALAAEKDAQSQQLSQALDETKAIASARDALASELGSTKKTLDDARTLSSERKVAFEQLQQKHGQLEAADLARQAELKKMQQTQQDAQQKLQALGAENSSIAQKLAGAQGQAKAAATAGADLSRALDSTKQTLVQARARAADLNKSYEKLLKDHSKLAATDAARKAELGTMRAAFEEAQNEVARLSGGRGIYTVQTADSLSSIAAYFYRKGHRWTDIQKENDFLAGNPDLIYAGQVLIIPK